MLDVHGRALAGGHLRPDPLRLVQVARAGVELAQSRDALVARGQVDELLLVAGGAVDVALLLGELGELRQELGVAGVGGQQTLELGAGGADVAGGGVRLRQAHRHVASLRRRRCAAARPIVALLVLEPGQEAVELVALEVQLGQLADDVELVVQVLGAVEGAPVHLDGFLGLVLAGEGLGEGQDGLGIAGVGADGAAEGVEPLLDPAVLEAELGEELGVLGAGRGRGQELAAGLDGLVDPPQPRLEPGDARRGTRRGCGGRCPRGGRRASAASPRLPADSRHAGRQRPGRDRSADRSRSRDRPPGPPRGACRRPRGTGPARSSDPTASRDAPPAPRRIAAIRAASRPAAWSFFTRDSPHRHPSARPARRAGRRRRAAISASSNWPSRCRYSASFIRRSKSSLSSSTASFKGAIASLT